MLGLSELIASDEFSQRARHPDFPNAFTRHRKLPLPALIASLVTMRASSQQSMLDAFFGAACGDQAVRGVSDRAFAKAREQLHMPALQRLNDWVLGQAAAAGFMPRWNGLRLVAADASVLMPALRASHRTRSAAAADQRLFMLYLPGAELTLHASVHSNTVSERAMLVEALDKLQPDDVLLLDRGYPAAWLVQLLIERGIKFIMRCDNDSGWGAVRQFIRGGANEAEVQLNKPSAQEACDWGIQRVGPRVRLVRQISPSGQIRVLATNLDVRSAPAQTFGELYHQRWRIEEAFKRLKHRAHLEAVSGLTQQALIVDVAAKVLADNLASLLCAAADEQHDLRARSRRCNRSYAAQLLPRILPSILLSVGDVLATIRDAITMLGTVTQRLIPGRSQPRPPNHHKPHPRYAYKG
jgi:Transposase DDE domain